MKSSAVYNYSADSPPAKTNISELLILNRCRQILLCELKSCLDCGACESVCERRHKERRWRGLPIAVGINGKYAVMPVCQGCATPACQEACPQQAIQPGKTSPKVQSAACTGCGRCVLACPFAAIACLPAQQKSRRKNSAAPGRKCAVKCDGCTDFSNRACLRECPTGALKVIDWVQFQQLQQ